MPSKFSTHGLGRGPSQSLIDAGAIGGKWVASDPPNTLPDKFIKVWRWVFNPDNLNSFLGNGNPEGSARLWWDRQWEHTKFVPKKPNTYVSGPNENRCETPAEAEYNNRFWLEWMRLCEIAGYKAAIFSFGTGRPPHPIWDTAQQGNIIWNNLKPALRYAKANGHVVDLHAYHENVDQGNMLRHQSVWAWLPIDCRPPIIIGEWGIDGTMGRFNDPLFTNQVPDPNGYYLNLIKDFDRRMQADPYVLLVTLFTEGTNNDERTWGPFNIEGKPIVGMLRDYIASQVSVPPVIVPPIVVPPVVTPPPVVPPIVPITPMPTPTSLQNGSFEKTNYIATPSGISGLLPPDWTLTSYSKPGDVKLPKQDQDWLQPEIIPIQYAVQFPDINLLYDRNGRFILKVFKGGAPTAASFEQKVDLPAGKYRFTVPIFPDQWHLVNGSLVRPSVQTSLDWYLASEVQISAADMDTGWLDARTVPIGKYTPVLVEFDWPGGIVTVGFAVHGRWGFKNNGWFIDGITLEPVTVVPPITPPPIVPPVVVPPPVVPPVVSPLVTRDLKGLDIAVWEMYDTRQGLIRDNRAKIVDLFKKLGAHPNIGIDWKLVANPTQGTPKFSGKVAIQAHGTPSPVRQDHDISSPTIATMYDNNYWWTVLDIWWDVGRTRWWFKIQNQGVNLGIGWIDTGANVDLSFIPQAPNNWLPSPRVAPLPTNSRMDFTMLDGTVFAFRDAGINIGAGLIYTIPDEYTLSLTGWNENARIDSKFVEQFKSDMRSICEHYKGVIKRWIFWNEDSWPDSEFIKRFDEFCTIAKEVDPTCKIAAGTPFSDKDAVDHTIPRVMALNVGSAGLYDAYSIHPYSKKDLNSDLNIAQVLDVIRTDPDKEVWVTEWGRDHTGTPFNIPSGASSTGERLQCDQLESGWRWLQNQPHVTYVSYHRLSDLPWNHYGIVSEGLWNGTGWFEFEAFTKMGELFIGTVTPPVVVPPVVPPIVPPVVPPVPKSWSQMSDSERDSLITVIKTKLNL